MEPGVDYEGLWSAGSPTEFGAALEEAWAAAYRAEMPAAELVVFQPGNGFSYLFDLAGSLGDEPQAWEPRVVGVWGRSEPPSGRRDAGVMRGFPRPARREDDRGHLIALASGGGYDVNLVPMDAGLNRGRSAEGARFRAMERAAARTPGTLFFIRPVYDDDTARPARFEVGLVVGEGAEGGGARVDVGVFSNRPSPSPPLPTASLRQAAPMRLDADVVVSCLDEDAPVDALFARAWREGLASLTRRERNLVAGVTGHIAESVVEVLLHGVGWSPLHHFTGPGRHGVDLVMLTPDERVVAVEVKGTLVAGRIPRLSRRELAQMTTSWLDKADNPGMAGLGLQSDDVYGAVAVVDMAGMTWRLAVTADFADLQPVTETAQLAGLGWLDSPPR